MKLAKILFVLSFVTVFSVNCGKSKSEDPMSTRSNRIPLILRLLPLCLATVFLLSVQSCSDANDTGWDAGTDSDTDTDADADTDPDAGTDTDPACVDAGGAALGGTCWFLGGSGASCTDTCSAISGTYNSATASYAGSMGNDIQCANLWD